MGLDVAAFEINNTREVSSAICVSSDEEACDLLDIDYMDSWAGFLSWLTNPPSLVEKAGARTGVTSFSVISLGVVREKFGRHLRCTVSNSTDDHEAYHSLVDINSPHIMQRQLLCLSDQENGFGKGDSGSILFDRSQNIGVAQLHMGGDSNDYSRIAISTPMPAVLQRLREYW